MSNIYLGQNKANFRHNMKDPQKKWFHRLYKLIRNDISNQFLDEMLKKKTQKVFLKKSISSLKYQQITEYSFLYPLFVHCFHFNL